MKKIIPIAIAVLGATGTSFSQIQIIKATKQRIVPGTGAVVINYAIEFRDKKNAVVEIDSVKAIADASVIPFYAGKNAVSFTEVLVPPAKCATCIETTPKPQNLTRGIIIYYRKNGKKAKRKVKEFSELPDIVQP